MKNLKLNVLAISMATAFCLSAQEAPQVPVASIVEPSHAVESAKGESVALEQAPDSAVNSPAAQVENQGSEMSDPEMAAPEPIVAPAPKKRRVSAARAAVEAEKKLWENWDSSQ